MPPCLDETAVAAIASGAQRDERTAWLAHVDACEACRQVVVAAMRAGRATTAEGADGDGGRAAGSDRDETIPAHPSARRRPAVHALEVGDSIGRYRITGVLGAGGMGVVYEARDPELDRPLAIKLLRDPVRASETALTARLVREAKALAQLAHPNVVAIHDVGEHAGCPFLAMELIRGDTLRSWLADKPRSWREIVVVFEQAARGLAAAHAANLVHRDFKPDNVMVGSDSRVRVTDFGLVRPAGTDEVRTAAAVTGDATLTQSGAVLGTPAYMSPEQHRGEPSDAKSDQYSFMVALYEAVYGVRPYVGDTPETLRSAVLQGEPTPPAVARRVPRWLRRMIERGLARNAANRHADMTTVANQLARGLTRRRTAWVATIAATALATSAIASVTLVAQSGADPCGSGRAQIAQTWNEATKARVRAAFLATGKPFAADAFRAVTTTLDDYAARWARAHRTTCEATEVRREQSAQLLDLRMSCLAARRGELQSFVGLLANADAELVARAPTSATQLSSLDECANNDVLSAIVPVPSAIRDRVRGLEAAGTKARAVGLAGKVQEAHDLMKPVLAEAKQLGHRPLEAEALHLMAGLEERLGNHTEAERLFREAIDAAEAGGHDRVKAQAWASLISLIGEVLAKPAEALALEPRARAVIERVRDDESRAMLDQATGRALMRAGDYPAARAKHEAALATFERLYGKDSIEVSGVLDGISVLLTDTGDYRAALAIAERVLAIRVTKLGDAHPEVAKAMMNLGTSQFTTGDAKTAVMTLRKAVALTSAAWGPRHATTALARANYGTLLQQMDQHAAAIEELEAALALGRELLGPKHLQVTHAMMALGNSHQAVGNLARAEQLIRECLAIREEVFGPEHPDVEIVLGNLAGVLSAKGDLDGAEQLLRRALAIAEKTRGRDHSGTNYHVTNLARIAVQRGKHADAIPLFERALASDTKQLGKEHPALAGHLSGLAATYVAVAQHAKAVPLLERSIVLWERAGELPTKVAFARIALAEALVASGGDRNHAHEQAALALASFEQQPTQNRQWIDYVKTWQRANPRR